MKWRKWLGLPHKFGAHPQEGKGADCLIMVWSILDEANIYHPAFEDKWLNMAKTNQWQQLESIWQKCTTKLDHPEEYAVTLFQNGPNGLGVAIVVDNGLLLVHHRRGVHWAPLNYLPGLNFYKFR